MKLSKISEQPTEVVEWSVQNLINKVWRKTAVINIGKAAFGWGRAFSDEDRKICRRINWWKTWYLLLKNLKDTLTGFTILQWDESLANTLKNTVINRVWREKAPLWELADAINGGRNEWAIRIIENAVIDDIPENRKSKWRQSC